MKIDNRFLIPFACPFAVAFVLKVMAFVLGAHVTADAMFALSAALGTLVGLIFAIAVSVVDVDFGHTYIGKKRDGG